MRPSAIGRRVDSGEYRALFRGVYLVGGTRTPKTMPMAATLACARACFVSHHSAAALHGLLPAGGPVDVTVTGGVRRVREGLTVHRTRAIREDEVMLIERIRVSTPARTILDLAPVLAIDDLEQLLATAFRRNLLRSTTLDRLLRRYPRRAGVHAIRELLDLGRSPAFTRSKAERLLLRLIRDAGLPEPEANRRSLGFEVDLVWPEHRFAIEIDGHQWHSDRLQREIDMHRDQQLDLRGVLIIRVSWRQITCEPDLVIARIRRHLEQRSPGRTPG